MELPKCAAFLHGECPRSDIRILKEGDDFWLIGCLTCKSSRVLSKPRAIDRARYEAIKSRVPIATKAETRLFMSHSKKTNLTQGFVLKG